jgi:class 3 adenylate cyclase
MTERMNLTILFADVSGSTKLFEMRGDEEARRLIGNVLVALGEITAAHGGRVVKTIGDELMCTFPAALNGMLAATDMQRRMKNDPAFDADNIGIRIGLHHGDALVEADGDVYGDAVNTAARMADKTLARRDQIVTTASTAADVSDVTGVHVRSLGSARVLGKLMPIDIVDVQWQEDLSNVTTVQRVLRIPVEDVPRMSLNLRFRGQSFSLDELSAPFGMGRDAASDLVIDAEWVSRNHALIEWKRGRFMLADRSTNGSWVRMGEDEEQFVHRDEIHLRKSGTISLGQAHAGKVDDLIHYECSEG